MPNQNILSLTSLDKDNVELSIDNEKLEVSTTIAGLGCCAFNLQQKQLRDDTNNSIKNFRNIIFKVMAYND